MDQKKALLKGQAVYLTTAQAETSAARLNFWLGALIGWIIGAGCIALVVYAVTLGVFK